MVLRASPRAGSGLSFVHGSRLDSADHDCAGRLDRARVRFDVQLGRSEWERLHTRRASEREVQNRPRQSEVGDHLRYGCKRATEPLAETSRHRDAGTGGPHAIDANGQTPLAKAATSFTLIP